MWPTDFAWRDLAAVTASSAVIGSAIIWWVKMKLSTDFASKSDIAGLSSRVGALEDQVRLAPKHSDLTALAERVSRVERGVDVCGATIEGVREGVGRVERDLAIIKQHLLRETAS